MVLCKVVVTWVTGTSVQRLGFAISSTCAESGLFSMGKSRPFWKFEHAQVLEFAKRSRVRVRLGGASPGKGEEGL